MRGIGQGVRRRPKRAKTRPLVGHIDLSDVVALLARCPASRCTTRLAGKSIWTIKWVIVNECWYKRAPVFIEVEGQAFERDATTIYFGQIGYLPSFELTPNDPMIEALQAGRNVDVTFGSARVRISLRGSRGAFDIFKANCGWNRLPVDD